MTCLSFGVLTVLFQRVEVAVVYQISTLGEILDKKRKAEVILDEIHKNGV